MREKRNLVIANEDVDSVGEWGCGFGLCFGFVVGFGYDKGLGAGALVGHHHCHCRSKNAYCHPKPVSGIEDSGSGTGIGVVEDEAVFALFVAAEDAADFDSVKRNSLVVGSAGIP